MIGLGKDYRQNVALMDDVLRVQENFDVIKKVMCLGKDEITLYYIDGFVDSGSMNKMMIYFLSLKSLGTPSDSGEDAAARYFCRHHLPHVEAEVSADADMLVHMVLSGTTLILGATFGPYGIVVDSRTYPTRSVEEPESDRVMLGSRDGFVETLVFNTALIRRRVRDPQLTMQYYSIGERSRTDVVLCYLEGQADPGYVKHLQARLRAIRTRALTMGHESLAELLIRDKWYNPFPKIRYTERPDVAAAQVMEGSVLIVVDNSPEVMIFPSTIFDFMQESNDFYFPPLTGSYIRLVRYLVFLATLLLTPAWFLLTKNPALAPDWLQFVLPESTGKISIFAQLLLVEFVIDGLRMASMNTPSMLSNSLSVVGGLILGDFAVDIGWLIPEVILYMAFVAIANFSQRSYQLGYAFKFMRIGLLICVQLLDGVGFLLGFGVCILLLATNKTANGRRSYLYPLIPFHPRALYTMLLRARKGRVPEEDGIRRKK